MRAGELPSLALTLRVPCLVSPVPGGGGGECVSAVLPELCGAQVMDAYVTLRNSSKISYKAAMK